MRFAFDSYLEWWSSEAAWAERFARVLRVFIQNYGEAIGSETSQSHLGRCPLHAYRKRNFFRVLSTWTCRRLCQLRRRGCCVYVCMRMYICVCVYVCMVIILGSNASGRSHNRRLIRSAGCQCMLKRKGFEFSSHLN